MKTLFISFVFLFSFGFLKAEKKINNECVYFPVDTTIYPLSVLAAIDFVGYYDRPVDSFLAHLPPGFVLSELLPMDNLKRRERLCVYYGNSIKFFVIVHNFQYISPYNTNRNWDIELFKKEKIGRIELHSNGDCIKGCNE